MGICVDGGNWLYNTTIQNGLLPYACEPLRTSKCAACISVESRGSLQRSWEKTFMKWSQRINGRVEAGAATIIENLLYSLEAGMRAPIVPPSLISIPADPAPRRHQSEICGRVYLRSSSPNVLT
ncbi:hypothetical protein RRG08_054069 [Elysia crispata]|uniref:Uncharacterized protein n=1 Tax=Elysia crispata TaxID=231223 RepID=A0AAE0ZDZ1_9GAST|nr:hypothetical protein RRG08_054069 [Elysia crispata]